MKPNQEERQIKMRSTCIFYIQKNPFHRVRDLMYPLRQKFNLNLRGWIEIKNSKLYQKICLWFSWYSKAIGFDRAI